MVVRGKGSTKHTIVVEVDGEKEAERQLDGVKRKSESFTKVIDKQSKRFDIASRRAATYRKALIAQGTSTKLATAQADIFRKKLLLSAGALEVTKKAAFDYRGTLIGLGIGLGVVAVGVKKLIDLTAQQELVEKKLAAVAGNRTKTLLAQASALQKVSIHGDEAIISAQTLLINIGGEKAKEQIEDATIATLELAAAFKWDLTQAARNVGRSYSGLQGELGEVVKEMRDLSSEELKQGKAIDLLIKKYGGQSKAETDTLFGAMSQANNAMSDTVQLMGSEVGIAKAATAAAKAVTSLANAVRSLNEATFAQNFAMLTAGKGGGPLGAIRLGAEGFLDPDKLIRQAKALGRFKAELIKQGVFAGVAPEVSGAADAPRAPVGGGGAGAVDTTEFERVGGGPGSRLGSAMPQNVLDLREKQREYEQQQQTYRLNNLDELRAAKFAAMSEEAEGQRLLFEQREKQHEQSMQNAASMRDAIIDAAQSSMHAYANFYGQLFNVSRKTMHKIQKAMLLIEGGMAVTRGVIALQNALATVVQSQGASLADVPGAVALISSGGMMMAGQLLTSARASSGGGGGGSAGGHGRTPRSLSGGMSQAGGTTYNLYLTSDIIYSEGDLGKVMYNAIAKARQEGQVAA